MIETLGSANMESVLGAKQILINETWESEGTPPLADSVIYKIRNARNLITTPIQEILMGQKDIDHAILVGTGVEGLMVTKGTVVMQVNSGSVGMLGQYRTSNGTRIRAAHRNDNAAFEVATIESFLNAILDDGAVALDFGIYGSRCQPSGINSPTNLLPIGPEYYRNLITDLVVDKKLYHTNVIDFLERNNSAETHYAAASTRKFGDMRHYSHRQKTRLLKISDDEKLLVRSHEV